VKRALLLLLSLPPVVRAEIAGPPVTANDYRVDLSHGPALGSTQQVGMGGAFMAVAHGAAALAENPAAVAARLPGADAWFDWDASVSSFAVGGKDFDNNGSASTAYSKHVVSQAGGFLQFGRWSGGLFTLSQQYDAETQGVPRRFQFNETHLAAGWRSGDSRVAWGGGFRIAEFKVTPRGGSQKLLHLSGSGAELGVVWSPEHVPLSFGAAYQGKIKDDPENPPPAVGSLVTPTGVRLPTTFSMGTAYKGAAPRPFTVAADVKILGRVKRANGIESFLEQRQQRSGRRASVSPRLGGESEVMPFRLRLRAGVYFEPSRFQGVSGRTHGTAGFEVRVGRVPWTWGRSLSIGYALDGAPRYLAQFVSLGFWH
jgi:hypothetical protein